MLCNEGSAGVVRLVFPGIRPADVRGLSTCIAGADIISASLECRFRDLCEGVKLCAGTDMLAGRPFFQEMRRYWRYRRYYLLK